MEDILIYIISFIPLKKRMRFRLVSRYISNVLLNTLSEKEQKLVYKKTLITSGIKLSIGKDITVVLTFYEIIKYIKNCGLKIIETSPLWLLDLLEHSNYKFYEACIINPQLIKKLLELIQNKLEYEKIKKNIMLITSIDDISRKCKLYIHDNIGPINPYLIDYYYHLSYLNETSFPDEYLLLHAIANFDNEYAINLMKKTPINLEHKIMASYMENEEILKIIDAQIKPINIKLCVEYFNKYMPQSSLLKYLIGLKAHDYDLDKWKHSKKYISAHETDYNMAAALGMTNLISKLSIPDYSIFGLLIHTILCKAPVNKGLKIMTILNPYFENLFEENMCPLFIQIIRRALKMCKHQEMINAFFNIKGVPKQWFS